MGHRLGESVELSRLEVAFPGKVYFGFSFVRCWFFGLCVHSCVFVEPEPAASLVHVRDVEVRAGERGGLGAGERASHGGRGRIVRFRQRYAF